MQFEEIAEKHMMILCSIHLKRYWCSVVGFHCLVMLCCCCFTGLCRNQWLVLWHVLVCTLLQSQGWC